MIQTIEKRVRIFHSVEVCTEVFCVAQYQMPSFGRYIYQARSFLHLTICKYNSVRALFVAWFFLKPNWYL